MTDFGHGASIKDFKGNLRIKSSGLSVISDVKANILAVGEGEAPSLGVLKDSKGEMVFCGFDIGAIRDFDGNVTIVNGDVGDISDTKGNITIIGGQITGKVTDSKANIRSY